jgi:hypothetical protein
VVPEIGVPFRLLKFPSPSIPRIAPNWTKKPSGLDANSAGMNAIRLFATDWTLMKWTSLFVLQ